jgi:hypothetical protein
MPGQLNPDKNLFSVAPVGSVVIIGRSMVLRGGLTREHALNLATWLLISANATPAEVKANIADAMTETPNLLRNLKTNLKTVTNARTVPQPAPPKAPPALASEVDPEVSGQVTPFIGTIDAEEAESIQAALVQPGRPDKAPQQAPAASLLAVKTVDPVALGAAWGKEDDNG